MESLGSPGESRTSIGFSTPSPGGGGGRKSYATPLARNEPEATSSPFYLNGRFKSPEADLEQLQVDNGLPFHESTADTPLATADQPTTPWSLHEDTQEEREGGLPTSPPQETSVKGNKPSSQEESKDKRNFFQRLILRGPLDTKTGLSPLEFGKLLTNGKGAPVENCSDSANPKPALIHFDAGTNKLKMCTPFPVKFLADTTEELDWQHVPMILSSVSVPGAFVLFCPTPSGGTKDFFFRLRFKGTPAQQAVIREKLSCLIPNIIQHGLFCHSSGHTMQTFQSSLGLESILMATTIASGEAALPALACCKGLEGVRQPDNCLHEIVCPCPQCCGCHPVHVPLCPCGHDAGFATAIALTTLANTVAKRTADNQQVVKGLKQGILELVKEWSLSKCYLLPEKAELETDIFKLAEDFFTMGPLTRCEKASYFKVRFDTLSSSLSNACGLKMIACGAKAIEQNNELLGRRGQPQEEHQGLSTENRQGIGRVERKLEEHKELSPDSREEILQEVRRLLGQKLEGVRKEVREEIREEVREEILQKEETHRQEMQQDQEKQMSFLEKFLSLLTPRKRECALVVLEEHNHETFATNGLADTCSNAVSSPVAADIASPVTREHSKRE